MTTNTKGVLLFAHNNEKINYYEIAIANALAIKHYLNVPVALVTDKTSVTEKSTAFDTIIYQEDQQQENVKLYRNTQLSTERLQFNNIDRCYAYDLSPYDETLVIDVDYIIQSSQLSQCWSSNYDIMINKQYTDIVAHRKIIDKYISPFSIEMYWATVVYFKKTNIAQQMFDTVKYVKNHYDFYTKLYMLPDNVYRNDFGFAIALHMLNGQGINSINVSHLPGKRLHQSFDSDEVYSVNGPANITFLANAASASDALLVNVKDTDIHIMNKWSLVDIVPKLRELYSS